MQLTQGLMADVMNGKVEEVASQLPADQSEDLWDLAGRLGRLGEDAKRKSGGPGPVDAMECQFTVIARVWKPVAF